MDSLSDFETNMDNVQSDNMIDVVNKNASQPISQFDVQQFTETSSKSFQQLIEDIGQSLKGFEFDYDKNRYIKRGRPHMNDVGVSYVKMVLKPILCENTVMSKLSSNQVDRIFVLIHNLLAKTLYNKYKEFELDRDILDDILYCVIGLPIYFTLMRAHEAGERGYRMTTQNTITRINEQTGMQSRPGIFSSFFGGR